jgi:hypothetical protein
LTLVVIALASAGTQLFLWNKGRQCFQEKNKGKKEEEDEETC